MAPTPFVSEVGSNGSCGADRGACATHLGAFSLLAAFLSTGAVGCAELLEAPLLLACAARTHARSDSALAGSNPSQPHANERTCWDCFHASVSFSSRMFSCGSQELCDASYPSHLMWYSSFPFLSLCPRILSTRNRGSFSADVPPRAPFCDGLAGFAAGFAPAGVSTAAGRAASALLAGRGSASEFAPAGFFGNPAASGAFCRFAAGGTGGAPCASAVRA